MDSLDGRMQSIHSISPEKISPRMWSAIVFISCAQVNRIWNSLISWRRETRTPRISSDVEWRQIQFNSLSQIKRRKCDSASAFNKSLCTKLFALEFCKLTLIDCDLCTTHHSLDVVALN